MDRINQREINDSGSRAKPSPRVNVDSAARLAGVVEAEKQLRKGKIPENDRVVLARNLGRMLKDALKRHDELSTRKVFLAAFGDADGESQYKKRKHLVWMPTEEGHASDLQRRAIKYLDLCAYLVQYLEYPRGLDEDGKRKLALLRLIEGSSFDQQEGRRERMDAEYRQELDNRLSTVVKRVHEAVDLDWMRQFVNDHPLYSAGLTGEFKPSNRAGGLQIMEATMEMTGGIQNCLAPMVRIASVFTRPKVDRYLMVETPISDDEDDSGKLTEKLAKVFATDSPEMADLVPRILEQEGWCDYDTDDPPCNLWFRSVIDMEIRYDVDSASWKPLLLWRRLLQDGFNPTGDEGQALDFFGLPYKGCEGVFLGFEEESYLYAVLEERLSGTCRWMLFVMDAFYDDYFDYSVQMFNTCLDSGFYPPNSDYEEFMFQKLDDWSENGACYELEGNFDCWRSESESGFVKAPPGSLACALLRNLAYVRDYRRVDALLVNDAKYKYQILKSHTGELENEYEAAIKRFESSTAERKL